MSGRWPVELDRGDVIGSARRRAVLHRDSIQTLTAARTEDGGWEFVSSQNTRVRPIGAGLISAMLWLVPRVTPSRA